MLVHGPIKYMGFAPRRQCEERSSSGAIRNDWVEMCANVWEVTGIMSDDDLSPEENKVIGGQVREELARRRISRQHLADKAKISLSTLEKALTGTRPLVARRFEQLPVYKVTGKGPDHAKTFSADVFVVGVHRGSGVGRSKKQAEQAAARQAWEIISAELATAVAPASAG